MLCSSSGGFWFSSDSVCVLFSFFLVFCFSPPDLVVFSGFDGVLVMCVFILLVGFLFIWLTSSYCVGADCLKEICELRLICLDFSSTVVPSILAHGAAFWILMGQSLLIRDREFVYSCVFMGRVDVFSGSLKA
jgi:hypothetical protein